MKTMKTSVKIILILLLTALLFNCKKSAEAIPAQDAAIAAKFKELSWDKDGHVNFNSKGIEKTKGGKGYVQYYSFGSSKTAIYFFEDKGAFGMNSNELLKYEALGADNFAYVTSDSKPSGTGSSHIEITIIRDNTAGIIITNPNVGTYAVYGDIYKKYLSLNRWTGVLGYPLNDESALRSNKGSYNAFAKTGTAPTGQIYYSTSTGAQAYWGKVHSLYAKTDFDVGWLGLPKESCDMAKGDANQKVAFENGSISVLADGTCGTYTDKTGKLSLQSGKQPAAGIGITCY